MDSRTQTADAKAYDSLLVVICKLNLDAYLDPSPCPRHLDLRSLLNDQRETTPISTWKTSRGVSVQAIMAASSEGFLWPEDCAEPPQGFVMMMNDTVHGDDESHQGPRGKRKTMSALSSGPDLRSPEAMNGNLAEAFRWPARFWSAMLQALDCSAATLQRSLLGKKLNISTHCSGIGAAEVAAEMLVANSARELGFSVSIRCTSACDTSPACRRVLVGHSSERHVFSNIFDFFPGWDEKLHEPEAVVKVLKEFCQEAQQRDCTQHMCRCQHPAVHGDICGSPCQPWSRSGKGRGSISTVALLF